MSSPDQSPENSNQPVSLSSLFLAWFQIGLNSFGGGQSTLGLIQRSLAAQKGWITNEEFAQANAMALMAPGINLIAITILIGDKLGKWPGIVVSLLGLLVPSVAVTILMTMGYTHIREIPSIIKAFHAIVPATVGIGAITGLMMLYAFVKPPALTNRSIEIALCLCVVVISYLLMLHHAPVLLVILGGGIVFSLAHHFMHKKIDAEKQVSETKP